MNEIAWKIINGLCKGIGWGFFLWFIFCKGTNKDLLKIGILAISGVLLALGFGYLLFN